MPLLIKVSEYQSLIASTTLDMASAEQPHADAEKGMEKEDSQTEEPAVVNGSEKLHCAKETVNDSKV